MQATPLKTADDDLRTHRFRYGFGIVDAGAAVDLARGWKPWAGETTVEARSDVAIKISDDRSVVESRVAVSAPDNWQQGSFVAETVVAHVTLQNHPSRGDLLVTLRSPNGMESVQHTARKPIAHAPASLASPS